MTDDPNKKDFASPPRKPGGIPLGVLSGSDATNALHETIKQFTRDSTRQTQKLIWLTKAIAALTIVMLIGLSVQIWLAWPPP